jgi:D-alanyl-D-alanine carboxypeptidase (penicillin-binding protein 5/6)
MRLRLFLMHLKGNLVALLLVLGPAAQAFETQATGAWVYDVTTHTVLMDKNADQPLPPASMSKLMTINMLFEALRDGRVTMDTTFPVSARAKAMGGSTMFLQETDQPTVNELLHGMIVNSGNDACVVVAEGLAGTEEAFSAQMTTRAKALGMTNSVFMNASGWPAEGHRMSMRDLGILGQRLIEVFPEYYPIFAETEFNYKDRAPDNRFNRNPLLKLNIGADGLKTGHTSEAGFGLVGSAQQGGRRVIFAITGLPSEAARADEAERIVSWAFRQFAEKTVAKAGVRIAEAEVFMGDAETVGLVPAEDLRLLVPALVQDKIEAEVVYKGPLVAPIEAGTPVAELIVHVPDLPDHRIQLVAETSVGKAGFVSRLRTAADALYTRAFGDAPAT